MTGRAVTASLKSRPEATFLLARPIEVEIVPVFSGILLRFCFPHMLNGIFGGSGVFIGAVRGTLGLSPAYKSKREDNATTTLLFSPPTASSSSSAQIRSHTLL